MKKILIVGCTSKLAKAFIASAADLFEIYGACRDQADAPAGLQACYSLNLEDSRSVFHFLDTLPGITFDAVLYAASTYKSDASDARAFAEQCVRDMQINTISALLIGQKIQLSDASVFITFGDAGLGMPKHGYTSYSLSKAALEQVVASLAIDRTDTSFLNIKLGPVIPSEGTKDAVAFYSRNLKRVDNPAQGLIELCISLIQISNLGMTGCSITYDGGAYLKRKS